MALCVRDIFLFVPNLIGYARIILMVISFYFMPTDYTITIFCYLTSQFLDALDGYAARYLDQSSLFGAMLDQLTDRASTLGLLFILSQFYPSYMLFFQIWVCIDIVSHWLHLHTTILSGKTSHKSIDLDQNQILHIYYTSRPVLFCMCAANELFFSSLYLLNFIDSPFWKFVAWFTMPVMVAKTGISLIHLYVAAVNLASVDVGQRAEKKEEVKKND